MSSENRRGMQGQARLDKEHVQERYMLDDIQDTTKEFSEEPLSDLLNPWQDI